MSFERFMPVERMEARLRVDREASDTDLCMGLLYFGECLIKLVTAAMVSAIREDRDRHRYQLAFKLVRADSLGDWVSALDETLRGPSAQFLDPVAYGCRNELTERVGKSDWRFMVTSGLHDTLAAVGASPDRLGGKLNLLRAMSLFAELRNKTRGHGATKSGLLADACKPLASSLQEFSARSSVFARPWAYLHRNLSGKYRVTPWTADSSPFDDLRSRDDIALASGVYIAWSKLRRVELIYSDPDATDYYLPNGAFGGGRYEVMSYAQGVTEKRSDETYSQPAAQLPPSHTEGIGELNPIGGLLDESPGCLERVRGATWT